MTTPAPDPIDAAAQSVSALLVSIAQSPSAPATAAFTTALARHGRNLADQAGPDALAAVLKRIRADAPDKAAAAERERIVLAAWEGLTQGAAA